MTFTVYSRTGCHLCEIMIEELIPLLRGRAEIKVIDIDTHPELLETYDLRVPVLAVGEQEICEFRLDRAAAEAAMLQAGESA